MSAAEPPPVTDHVQCSRCGKRCSNEVAVLSRGPLVVRAWVECPECIRKHADDGPSRMRDLVDEPWCLTCQNTHIPDIPATTFLCASDCGFGQWTVDMASQHADDTGHNVYPILHTLVPAEDREHHHRARDWVESEVSDWYDPVMSPEIVDAVRTAVGLPREDRT